MQCLKHQTQKCATQLAAATARGDETAASFAQHLDDEFEMVHDMPSWHSGRILDYGSLHTDAWRRLTQDEIASNEELMRQEAVAAAADATGAAAPLDTHDDGADDGDVGPGIPASHSRAGVSPRRTRSGGASRGSVSVC